jgi:type II secretory pathway component PulF
MTDVQEVRKRLQMLRVCLRELEEPKFEGMETKEFYKHKGFVVLADQLVFLVDAGVRPEEAGPYLDEIRSKIEAGGSFSDAAAAGLDFEHPWPQRTAILREMLDCAHTILFASASGG